MKDAPAFPAPRARVVTATPLRRSLGVLAVMAGGALFGAGLAVLASHFTPPQALAGLLGTAHWDLVTLCAIPVLWLLAIGGHELGHLLAGRLAGMRALSFIVGPLHIDFADSGWRWQANRSWSAAGGLARVMPTARTSRGGLIAMVAGGPLASVLLALGALGLVPVLPGSWGGLAGALAVLSALIAIATLVPLRAGVPTDGAQLLGLLRRDPDTRQRLLQLAVLGAIGAGLRPREWDAALLEGLDAGTSDPLTRCGNLWLLALRALDAGDAAGADLWWRRLAECINAADDRAMAPALRASWALALAGWIADHHGDAHTARAWAAESSRAFCDPAARAYTEAAVAVAEGGDPAAARAAIEHARSALRGSPFPGLRPLNMARLDALAARLPTAARTLAASAS